MTRREFFRRGAVLTGGLLLPRWVQGAAGEPVPDVVHVTGGAPEEAVRAAVNGLGGIGAFVRRGQKVVISPNVAFPNPPEMATTSDRRVVAAVIDLCKEAGASRIVVASYPVRDPDLCFERTGIGDLARMNGVEVVPLSSGSAYTPVQIPDAVEVHEVEVATIVRESDVLISIPVAKSHSSAGVSLTMKGHMGLIRSRGPFHSRYDLHQAIVDLSKIIRPNLIVTDAQRALVTRGPGGPGRIETPRAILAGTNQATVDAYTVGLANWYDRAFTADQVQHIKLAHEQGLGVIDLRRMNLSRVVLYSPHV